MCVNTTNLQLLPQGVMIVWEWEWTEESAASPTLLRALHKLDPYNLAAALPSNVVKRIMGLEFVDMSELRADNWPDEAKVQVPDPGQATSKQHKGVAGMLWQDGSCTSYTLSRKRSRAVGLPVNNTEGSSHIRRVK